MAIIQLRFLKSQNFNCWYGLKWQYVICQIVLIRPIVAKIWWFNWWRVCHLQFLKFEILTTNSIQKGNMHHCVKFCGDSSNTCWDVLIYWPFTKWRPSTILNWLYLCLDHPQRVFGSLYHRTKFGWNQCSSFDNMEVLIFCEVGFKTSINVPKVRVLGRYDP